MDESLLRLLHTRVLADGLVGVKLVREPTQHSSRELCEAALLGAAVRAKQALYQIISPRRLGGTHTHNDHDNDIITSDNSSYRKTTLLCPRIVPVS
jgi:hypothetical protein